MLRVINKSQIVNDEFLINSLLLLTLLAAFSSYTSFQNYSLNSGSGVFSNSIKPDTSIFFVKDKDKKKEDEQKIKVVDIAAETQKWETGIKERYKYGQIKTIDEGIKHISLTRKINNRPIRINVVEINKTINPNINFAPALATQNKLATKGSIRKIAQNNNSVVAINGSFFKPQNGIPLGSLMIDGKLLTGPMYNRVALGIFDNDLKIDRVELNARAENENYSLKIDNINQPRMLSTYVLAYTSEWGEFAPPSPKYGMQVAIENGKIVN